jgi:hypothetical protein
MVYARIAAAIDFINRTAEDVWRRQISHTLRVSRAYQKAKELNEQRQ